MAWIRKLPSGLWAATVRTPAGRITESYELKSQAKSWADEQESQVNRGDWIDPRKAKTLIGDWWERTRGAKHRSKAAAARDASHWKVHVAPRWAKIPLGAVLKADVSRWVVDMEQAKVGAATIEGAVGVLIGLFDLAIDDGMLRTNPARRVARPERDAHVDRVLGAAEERQLVAAAGRVFPGRVDAGLFIEILAETGMRWEEAAAVPPEMVDTRRQRINIAWVMERDGTARPYAKSEAGNRPVTYGDHLAARIREAKLAARQVAGVYPAGGPTRLLVTTPDGKALRYTNWRARVWVPVLHGLPERPTVKGHAYRPAVAGAGLDDPQPTAHDLRHTVGTRYADEGVPIHDIMALLGQKDIRSTQRYLHSREERFGRAREAMKRSRSS